MTTATMDAPVLPARKPRTSFGKKSYASTGEIVPDALYSVDDACARLRWGAWAIRQARRNGLKVIRTAGRMYLRGSDIIAYFDRLATEQAK